MVYKNDIDKYIQMKSKDIVSNTMEKLRNHLNEINKADNESLEEIITHSRRIITKKYNDFQKDDSIQDNVNNLMYSIFDNKKLDAIKIAENIINNKLNIDGY